MIILLDPKRPNSWSTPLAWANSATGFLHAVDRCSTAISRRRRVPPKASGRPSTWIDQSASDASPCRVASLFADHVRVGLAEEQAPGDPHRRAASREGATRLLAEARIDEHASALEEQSSAGAGTRHKSGRSSPSSKGLRRMSGCRRSSVSGSKFLADKIGADHGETGPIGGSRAREDFRPRAGRRRAPCRAGRAALPARTGRRARGPGAIRAADRSASGTSGSARFHAFHLAALARAVGPVEWQQRRPSSSPERGHTPR
jgi:hypothetical protein